MLTAKSWTRLVPQETHRCPPAHFCPVAHTALCQVGGPLVPSCPPLLGRPHRLVPGRRVGWVCFFTLPCRNTCCLRLFLWPREARPAGSFTSPQPCEGGAVFTLHTRKWHRKRRVPEPASAALQILSAGYVEVQGVAIDHEHSRPSLLKPDPCSCKSSMAPVNLLWTSGSTF